MPICPVCDREYRVNAVGRTRKHCPNRSCKTERARRELERAEADARIRQIVREAVRVFRAGEGKEPVRPVFARKAYRSTVKQEGVENGHNGNGAPQAEEVQA